MGTFLERPFEVFIVSGDSVNCARTMRSLLAAGHREPVRVYADWPVQELPADLRDRIVYVPQEKPFAITRENNRALAHIWGRNHDAVLIEDDVVLHTPGAFRKLSQYAQAMGGRCLLSPGIKGFKYENVVCEPNPHLTLYREPVHYPIICAYFPVELELLVGYYDERYTSYGCDDNDYSLRCLRAGVPMYCAPQLVAEHLYDTSIFKARGRDQTASRAKFKAKWGEYPGDPKLR